MAERRKGMTYEFTYSFEGYKTFEVEADSHEEAEKKARTLASEVDCGDLENVDMYPVDPNML